MTLQQIFASFIGTFFGFILAIVLFLITDTVKARSAKKILRKHLKRELEYDITLIQKFIDDIDKILHKITTDDSSVSTYLKYNYLQRSFIQRAFETGIMYDELNNDDISQLNALIMHCNFGSEQYVNELIQSWRERRQEQKGALGKFEFEKELLQNYKKLLEEILKKLTK